MGEKETRLIAAEWGPFRVRATFQDSRSNRLTSFSRPGTASRLPPSGCHAMPLRLAEVTSTYSHPLPTCLRVSHVKPFMGYTSVQRVKACQDLCGMNGFSLLLHMHTILLCQIVIVSTPGCFAGRHPVKVVHRGSGAVGAERQKDLCRWRLLRMPHAVQVWQSG